MIPILVLRATLTSLLASLLGTYTHVGSDGFPWNPPAIWLEDGSPTPAKVEGLEVVISPDTDVSVSPTIRGYQVSSPLLITLKQWDTKKTTLEALEVILAMPELTVLDIRRVPRNENLDNIEITTIRVLNGYFSHQ